MPGAHQRQRFVLPDDALDEYLDLAASVLATEQARLDHARVVENQQVTRSDQARKLGKAPVVDRTAGAVQMQEPARAPLGQRALRDQFFRKRVVELRGFHPRAL